MVNAEISDAVQGSDTTMFNSSTKACAKKNLSYQLIIAANLKFTIAMRPIKLSS